MSHLVEHLSNELMDRGYIITAFWWKWHGKQQLKLLAREDFYIDNRIKFIKKRDLFAIDECDILVLLADPNEELDFNGANFELGYAVAKGKKVYIIGKLGLCALYSGIMFFSDINEFLEHISGN